MNINLLKELAKDYADKLQTPIYIGIRTGYLQNENEVLSLIEEGFVVNSPIAVVKDFKNKYLSNE